MDNNETVNNNNELKMKTRYAIKNIGNGCRTEDPYGTKVFNEAEARDYVNALKKYHPDAEFCGFNTAFKSWVCHYTPSV